MQLFREDVLRCQMETHLGAIRLGRPLSFAVVTATALCVGVALIAFAARAHLTRKATLNGLLWPAHGSLKPWRRAEPRWKPSGVAPHQDLPPGVATREPFYRLTRLARQSIDVYGRSDALKPGMTLRADVHQDRCATPVVGNGTGSVDLPSHEQTRQLKRNQSN